MKISRITTLATDKMGKTYVILGLGLLLWVAFAIYVAFDFFTQVD